MATAAPKSKPGLVRKSIHSIKPSPVNDTIYRPPDPKDPDLRALARSIRDEGLLDPIVITLDNQIVSGHRRHAACKMANIKTVRCRVLMIDSRKDPDGFVKLLREYNRHRVKTADEVLREEIISADPKDAHARLRQHRQQQGVEPIDRVRIDGSKVRDEISALKWPMLNAALDILKKRFAGGFLPTNLRSIYYALLNNPPLRNNRDRFGANDKSYKDLSDLLSRARLTGLIHESWITDETRPSTTWGVHQSIGAFIRWDINRFLKSYTRDLMQSQPNHIEIWAEKLTVKNIVETVAVGFTIPVTICRGYPSIPPRQQLVKRFRRSGKQRLVIIAVTDHDADGEEIVQSLGRSMRDDFGINVLDVVKAALTRDQVNELGISFGVPAKKGKTKNDKYKRFIAEYGPVAYELEALGPAKLQELLREAIDSVIDISAFNNEVDREAEDAAYLEGVRNKVHELLAGLKLGDDEA